MLRFTLVFIGVLACVLVMLNSLRIGQARALVTKSRSLAGISKAVELSPDDPEVYRARAAVLSKTSEFGLAIDDLRQAIALRPHDYKLWIELAWLLDKTGDTGAALAAASEARSLAPFYFAVHLYTATFLEKLGRYDEAFAQLRAAALTTPEIQQSTMEKAWNFYQGNCGAVERAMEPRSSQERLALARFFLSKNRPDEAIRLIHLVSDLADAERRDLLEDFLKARQFRQAYEMWAWVRADKPIGRALGTIDNGSFESEQLSDEASFTWKIDYGIHGVSYSLDNGTAYSGLSSLRLNWNGAANPLDKVISQLILVKPNTRYELKFAARTQALTTGGPPLVTIIDVSQKESRTVAHSSALPLRNTNWQELTVGFATGESTNAIQIVLQRQNCSEQPCPIFGTLWLDDFRLTER